MHPLTRFEEYYGKKLSEGDSSRSLMYRTMHLLDWIHNILQLGTMAIDEDLECLDIYPVQFTYTWEGHCYKFFLGEDQEEPEVWLETRYVGDHRDDFLQDLYWKSTTGKRLGVDTGI